MLFSGSRPTEFPFILPPPRRCQERVRSPRKPGRALQVPTPPNLGVLNSFISLPPINQALGHPVMHFSGSRQTEFPFILPPLQRCQKWGFSPHQPGRAFHVPTPPNLGVLNSIISPIAINQALGHPKMRFRGSKLTEFPFIHPPTQTVPKWVFSPHEPGRAIQVHTPPNLGVLYINSDTKFHQPSAGPSRNAFFLGPDQQNFRLSTPPPLAAPDN